MIVQQLEHQVQLQEDIMLEVEEEVQVHVLQLQEQGEQEEVEILDQQILVLVFKLGQLIQVEEVVEVLDMVVEELPVDRELLL